MNKFQIVENLAFFLLEKTGRVCGAWSGKLSANDQRQLFGKFIGKGRIVINGDDETLRHIVKVCFGLDYDVTFNSKWSDINE